MKLISIGPSILFFPSFFPPSFSLPSINRMERDQCTRYGKAILFHISRDAKGDARGPDVKWAKTRNGMLIEEEEGGGGSIFPNRKPGFSLTRGGEYTWTEFFRKSVSRNGLFFFYFLFFLFCVV